ncbi:MAG TPA: hypothetical protein VHM90_02040 [Phycisphaerae bacterium]|nr:hypothetical protein [Phycisphaerae bacterium]
MRRYDAIVIGARCAGSPLAMLMPAQPFYAPENLRRMRQSAA